MITLEQLNRLEEQLLLDFYDNLVVHTTEIVAGLSALYSQTADPSTINVDAYIRGELEKKVPLLRQQIVDIASRAKQNIDINYDMFIGSATNSLYNQLLTYLLNDNPQIKHLRKLIAGQETQSRTLQWVLPTPIAIWTLAVLSGVTYNSKTGIPDQNVLGQYIAGGNLSVGTLYTGHKAIKDYSERYFDEHGLSPSFEYEWQHLRNFGKMFPPHVRLDGKKITNQNWRTVLANTTDPWLGIAYHHPQSHKGCLCRLKILLAN